MTNFVRRATHFGSPVLVDDSVSQGLFVDCSINEFSRLTSKTYLMDFLTVEGDFDQSTAAGQKADGYNWAFADIQGTLGTADYNTVLATDRPGLRLQAGAATDEGIAMSRTNSSADVWNPRAAANTNEGVNSPIVCLGCFEFDTVPLENDFFFGMVSQVVSTTVPISSTGALISNVDLFGFHVQALDSDAYVAPQGKAVGDGNAIITQTDVDGGIAQWTENNIWLGMRLDSNDTLTFYFGTDPYRMRRTGSISMPSTNDLPTNNGFGPCLAWNQGDTADNSAHNVFVKKLLVHQPNTLL